jgi:hypothetical protein
MKAFQIENKKTCNVIGIFYGVDALDAFRAFVADCGYPENSEHMKAIPEYIGVFPLECDE